MSSLDTMAFQRDNVFSEFLRQTARKPAVSESAPAANFLLDERVPEQRETVFLAGGPTASGSGWNSDSWLRTFGNHYAAHIGVPTSGARRCATFAAINQSNHLASTEPNQDVVRLESVAGFYERAKAGFDSLDKLDAALRYFTSHRDGAIDPNEKSRLETWVDELNRKRDARPMFVAPFGEVESLLKLPDWATQLRNMLGLVHFGGTPNKPLPVMLMRYNLSRAEQTSRKIKMNNWTAVPTVLEAGNNKGPGTAFFPFPKSAVSGNGIGFGTTVSLGSGDGLDFKSELLHFRIDYKLDDFWMFGEIKDAIDEPQLGLARRRHFEILERDFRFRNDVP
jgi:hypothetical protein